MSANVDTMAYNRVEVPWHGMGNPVDADLTPEEMVEAAKIGWGVELRPIFYKNGKHIEIPGKKALVRCDNDSLLDVVGGNWKPIQNADAMDFFTKFVKAGGMSMETMGSLDEGRYIWGLARLDKSFKIGKNDENLGYLLLAHPHIFGKSFILQTTAIRVVCQNTYNAALGAGSNNKWSMRHSRTFDDVSKSEAEIALGIAVEEFQQFGEMAKFLAKKKASDEWVKKYFYDVLQLKPKKNKDEVESDPRSIDRIMGIFHNAPGQEINSARGTWWGAFNGVTYLTDHVIGKDQDSRLARSWFGDRSLMKRQALTKAVEYSEFV